VKAVACSVVRTGVTAAVQCRHVVHSTAVLSSHMSARACERAVQSFVLLALLVLRVLKAHEQRA
jgi:hypothetical protein